MEQQRVGFRLPRTELVIQNVGVDAAEVNLHIDVFVVAVAYDQVREVGILSPRVRCFMAVPNINCGAATSWSVPCEALKLARRPKSEKVRATTRSCVPCNRKSS